MFCPVAVSQTCTVLSVPPPLVEAIRLPSGDHARVPIVGGEPIAAARIPHLDRLVQAGGGERAAIRRPGQGADTATMSVIGEAACTRRRSQYLDRAIESAAGNVPAIGRPCQGVDRVGWMAVGCAIERAANRPQLGGRKNDRGTLLALSRLFQSVREVLYAWVTLVWVLGECLQH